MKLRDLFIQVAFRMDAAGTKDIGKVNRKVEEFSKVVKSINMAGFIAKVTAVRYALNSLKWGLEKVTGLFTSFLKAGSDKERIDITFEVLTKNVELGKKVLSDLHDLAVTRPFTVPEVESGAAVLLAMGFEAENLRDMMGQISDITAALPNLTLKRFAYNLGQVRAATYLRGMELRDFISQGVPLIDELLKLEDFKGLGTQQLRELIERRQVSFEHVQQAISNMTAEGGLFFQMSERIMTTLHGMYTNFLDALVVVRREIGARLTPVVTPFFQRFIDFFRENREMIINVIAEPLKIVLTLFVNLLDAFGYIIKSMYMVIDYTIGFRRMLNILRFVIQILVGRALLGAMVGLVAKIGAGFIMWHAAIVKFYGSFAIGLLIQSLAKILTLLIKIAKVIKVIFAPIMLKIAFGAIIALMVEDFYLYSKYGDSIDTATGRLMKQFPWLKKGYLLLREIGGVIAGIIRFMITGDMGQLEESLINFMNILDNSLSYLTGIDNVLGKIAIKLERIGKLAKPFKWLIKEAVISTPTMGSGGLVMPDNLRPDYQFRKRIAEEARQKEEEEKRKIQRNEFRNRFAPQTTENINVNVDVKGVGGRNKNKIAEDIKRVIEDVIEKESKVEPIPGAAR